jgi:cytochrome b6-f complex iron-sulfur subunit
MLERNAKGGATIHASEPQPHAPAGPHELPRRAFLLTMGWGGLAVLCAASGPALLRFLWPRGGRGDLDEVDAGLTSDYQGIRVSTRWIALHGLWLVNQDGRLFALEARCTHLGCTPRWEPERDCFHCPCHGSRFSTEGAPLNGPATLPLYRLSIRIEHDQIVIDRSVRASMEEAERNPRFYVRG